MLKVIAEHFIKEDAIQTVLPLYRELIQATRQEPLNISYNLHIDQSNPGHFIFIEEWPNLEALEVHKATAHFTQLIPMLQTHMQKDQSVMLLTPFE